MWDIETPALATLLRGLLYTEIALRGPSHDLHSGLYGGAVPNPLNVLTRILGQLHDGEGPHAGAGLLRRASSSRAPEEARQHAALPFDEAAFLASAGIGTPTGEAGRSTLERIWTRPTCDINGIWGGYTGPGSKTVIPAEARAKVSFRLVPGQDPARILDGPARVRRGAHARRLPHRDHQPRRLGGAAHPDRFALRAGGGRARWPGPSIGRRC